MTARDLIESIFARPQQRIAPEMCRVTVEQLAYLRDLIARDAERDRVRAGAPGSLIWTPSGAYRYVLTEDAMGAKHTVSRFFNYSAGDCLFDDL